MIWENALLIFKKSPNTSALTQLAAASLHRHVCSLPRRVGADASAAPTRLHRRVRTDASTPRRLHPRVCFDRSGPTRLRRRVCPDASAPTRLRRRVCAEASTPRRLHRGPRESSTPEKGIEICIQRRSCVSTPEFNAGGSSFNAGVMNFNARGKFHRWRFQALTFGIET